MADHEPVFHLTPAAAHDGMLEFSHPDANIAKLHTAIYREGCKELPGDNFDLDPKNALSFIRALDTKIIAMEWSAIFSIPADIDEPAQDLAFVHSEFGRRTTEQVRNHVVTYIDEPNRDAQNNMMAFTCIQASLTTEAKSTVNKLRAEFEIDGMPSAALLTKVIMKCTIPNNRSTPLSYRNQLAALDKVMISNESDIEAFNKEVSGLTNGLTMFGETMSDAIPNLFRGYMACEDKSFVVYMRNKLDRYEDGEADYTQEELMELAVNKYTDIKSRGEWKKLSKAEETVIALQSKLNKARAGNNAGETSGSNRGGKSKIPEPSWVRKPPTDGKEVKQDADGNLFYWCAHHKKWSLSASHTTSTCKRINLPDEKKDNGGDKDGSGTMGKIEQALKATIEE